MRLWHKDLISVLPNSQLKGQWNEINAIIGAINKHNSPRHGLVNYIMEYSVEDFKKYCTLILSEIIKRNDNGSIKYNPTSSVDKVNLFFEYPKWIGEYTTEKLYEYHHDLKYLEICYWNLYEKYIRDLITDEEFELLESKYREMKNNG